MVAGGQGCAGSGAGTVKTAVLALMATIFFSGSIAIAGSIETLNIRYDCTINSVYNSLSNDSRDVGYIQNIYTSLSNRRYYDAHGSLKSRIGPQYGMKGVCRVRIPAITTNCQVSLIASEMRNLSVIRNEDPFEQVDLDCLISDNRLQVSSLDPVSVYLTMIRRIYSHWNICQNYSEYRDSFKPNTRFPAKDIPESWYVMGQLAQHCGSQNDALHYYTQSAGRGYIPAQNMINSGVIREGGK